MNIWKHLTAAALLLLHAGYAAEAQTPAAHTFHVFLRGAEAGTEEVTLLETAEGWTLRGSGRLSIPVALSTEYWEARYDRDWKPLELTINQSAAADRWAVHASFNGTTASTEVSHNGQNQSRTQTISADALVLPNLIFGSYEALAARLAAAGTGSRLPAFIAPQDEIAVTVSRVSDEKIQVPGRVIDAKHWTLLLGSPGGALDMDVWTDAGRLLRIDIPTQMLSVIRDDISVVSARLLTMGRANDEQVYVPANGFSLAATVSKPASAAARLPAVVLVSSSDNTDRDEIVAGIPIFAQLATAFADAGFLVLRYDRRGTGQSGGRPESATYDDFSADLRAVLAYLGKRKDVDAKKIALLGYGEGGWIASTTAGRDSRVAALMLVGTPSAIGMDLVLEQQQRLLEGNNATPEAKAKAVEQQKAILQAVITGKGWEALTPEIRRRVDTPLYRSFLTFDPAQALSKTRQPLVVVQAELDREVPAYHGEQLAQLGRARQKARGTDLVRLPGLNHLLARAETGAISEYATLAERTVSPAATLEMTAWLRKTFIAPETAK